MLVSEIKKDGSFSSAWVDSWHQSETFLLSKGTRGPGGDITLFGTYPAPPDPDWGWKTIIRPIGEDSLDILMYNVTPQGDEELATRNTYRRG